MSGYSTRQVAEWLDLSPARVRRLVRSGLVHPERGPGNAYRFSFQDLILLRSARELRQAGVSPGRVRKALVDLRETLPEGRPLSAVRVGAAGGRVVVRDGDAVWSPESGQLQFDFAVAEPAGRDTRDDPATGTALRSGPERDEEDSAERWFVLGCELESSDPAEARAAYRRALELDPAHADARVNVGNLLLEDGQAEAAAEHYRLALRSDPENALANFNLGVALEEMERFAEAAEAYRTALEVDPELADAHYNLAGVLERRGDRGGALRHLRAYRELRRAGG